MFWSDIGCRQAVRGLKKATQHGKPCIGEMRNESTCIKPWRVHRLTNPGVIDLVMIDVQSGECMGEDDMLRFTDSYGRAPEPASN